MKMILRDNLKLLSERYHGQIHLSLGLIIGLWVGIILEGNIVVLMMVSAIATFLPDIDHLFFLFLYGKRSRYATEARKVWWLKGFRGYIDYCKKNHKNNTAIVSHNVLSMLTLLILGGYFGYRGEAFWTVVFLSGAGHFIFDIAEDWLILGRINGNWWFNYGSSSANKFGTDIIEIDRVPREFLGGLGVVNSNVSCE